MKATYVSVWDNGSDRVSSSCEFNPETKEVTDIEVVDVEERGLNYLDEEYIELPTGEVIRDFIRDGLNVVDGIIED
jgi:hypothetical protein